MPKKFITIISSLMFFLAWPPFPLFFLIFIAFVPLLTLGNKHFDQIKISFWQYLLITYLYFFLANLSITYWIFGVSFEAGLIVHLVNPILLSLPFICYFVSQAYIPRIVSYLFFVSAWLSIEFLHYNWVLSFPFLTLGYSLSMFPQIIQFYEYSGVLGGSLIIILINVSTSELVYKLIFLKRKLRISYSVALFATLVTPFVFSLITYNREMQIEEQETVNIAIMHPSMDCRNEKYAKPVQEIVNDYLRISKDAISDSIDFLVWPETAIPNLGLINQLNQNPIIRLIDDTLLAKFPELNLVTGAILFNDVDRRNVNEAYEQNLIFSKELGRWFVSYNAMVQLKHEQTEIPIRTKNKLVPIEETIPTGSFFKFMRSMIGSQGGFHFVYDSNYPDVFEPDEKSKYSALICYESVFGNYIGDIVNQGAEFLFVSLNECWYNNKRAASQFMHYARCHAIETRRYIARSSNLGYSGLINQKGDIEKSYFGSDPKVILGSVSRNTTKTFYTTYGDIVGVFSLYIFIGCLMTNAFLIIRKNVNNKKID